MCECEPIMMEAFRSERGDTIFFFNPRAFIMSPKFPNEESQSTRAEESFGYCVLVF